MGHTNGQASACGIDVPRASFSRALFWSALTLCLVLAMPLPAGTVPHHPDLAYINTSFENASPLYWETDPNGLVHVYLVYDQERNSPNRANGHWFFQLQTAPGAVLTVVLHNFDNVWNGRQGSPVKGGTVCFVSEDAKTWRALPAETTAENTVKVTVVSESGALYMARLEPYRLSDLERLQREIRGPPRVEIITIGKTVQGRELEIIRIGDPNAPHRVLLRARAHPWESGGNWVVEGLIERLLRDDADAARFGREFCVYVMPMANKDGVAHGRTRFNMMGADLNRKWDQSPDPRVNPENYALEAWLETMVAKGHRPDLMIDLHNDSYGKLHVSRPNIDLESYLKSMEVLEVALRRHTWFTEGSTGAGYRNPGTIGEGLLERFGITACVLELNANWIAGLDDYPSARHWQSFGARLCEVFYHYFDTTGAD
ncbi:MAG: succinylglutamate desuccinylase/aspartoacylase family protein [Sedimentisphaerales bacterium]|nr:succinylglutamate desuccinylase/aspartoacylase family protein [Sedimentisphaerales bacterium]